MCSSKEITSRRERYTSRDATRFESVNHSASRNVECANGRIQRSCDEPSRIGGEVDVENTSAESSKFTDDTRRLDVDDAHDEVIAYDGQETIVALKKDGCR